VRKEVDASVYGVKYCEQEEMVTSQRSSGMCKNTAKVDCGCFESPGEDGKSSC
jgi:hypothetical protein